MEHTDTTMRMATNPETLLMMIARVLLGTVFGGAEGSKRPAKFESFLFGDGLSCEAVENVVAGTGVAKSNLFD